MQEDSPEVVDTVSDVLGLALNAVVGLIEEEGERARCARVLGSTGVSISVWTGATATSDGGGAWTRRWPPPSATPRRSPCLCGCRAASAATCSYAATACGEHIRSDSPADQRGDLADPHRS